MKKCVTELLVWFFFPRLNIFSCYFFHLDFLYCELLVNNLTHFYTELLSYFPMKRVIFILQRYYSFVVLMCCKYLPPFRGLTFHFFYSIFSCTEVLILLSFLSLNLSIFSCIVCICCVWFKKSFPIPNISSQQSYFCLFSTFDL